MLRLFSIGALSQLTLLGLPNRNRHPPSIHFYVKQKWKLWATDQWNLADVALAEWEISGGDDHLDDAQAHLNDAHAVFEQGLSEYQLSKCDELQGQVDAARGSGA